MEKVGLSDSSDLMTQVGPTMAKRFGYGFLHSKINTSLLECVAIPSQFQG